MSGATEVAGELIALSSETSLGRVVAGEIAVGAERLLGKQAPKLLEMAGFDVAATVEHSPAQTEALELLGARFPRTLKKGADFRYGLTVDGERRLLDVHLPPLFNPEAKTPLFFLADGAQYSSVHGEMLKGYHWMDTADDNGFVAVQLVHSPNSSLPLPERYLRLMPHNSTWRTSGGFTNPSKTVNDENYFSKVLQGISSSMLVDKDSINFVGFCDGGLYGHTLARSFNFNGLATVASTALKSTMRGPLDTKRALFATIEDDAIIPPGGGAGRSFGKFLLKMGHKNILESQPLMQGRVYADARNLSRGPVSETEHSSQKLWWDAAGTPKVVELSLKDGGHNWPGTLFDSAQMQEARQLSPARARSFNQSIVEFLQHGKTPVGSSLNRQRLSA